MWGVPLLPMAFLLASLLKVAQGSSTVAMITTSSILAPILVASPPAFHPVYLAVTVASGSLVGSWMNDSGFWVYKQMSGLTETEALKTWTPLLALLGVTGGVFAMLGATLLPLR
jgi:H+/gluconate symporter-like permease